MTDEAFCLAGLLKSRESFDRVACLLPPGRRETILRLAGELAALPAQELQNRLCALRDAAALRVKELLTRKLGTGWTELSPLLQHWLSEVELRTYGS